MGFLHKSIFSDGLGGVSNKKASASQTTGTVTEKSKAEKRKSLSHIRPVYKEMGKAYGYTEEEMDRNITFDPETGQVYLAGVNQGTPDVVDDGKSYYDMNRLKTNFESTMKSLGRTKSPESVYRENVSSLGNSFAEAKDRNAADYYANQAYKDENRARVRDNTDYYKKTYEDFVEMSNENPYSGAIADSIYSIYGEKGRNAAGDAVATIAGSNSGNVDSYAAANARRQQLAYINAASDQILKANQARLDGIRQFGESLGLRFTNEENYLTEENKQRDEAYKNSQDYLVKNNEAWQSFVDSLHGNNEDTKLNDSTVQSQRVQDDMLMSATMGEGIGLLSTRGNDYFNEKGELRNPNLNYEEMKREAEARGDTEEVEKLNEAIRYKIQMPEYQQHARYVPSSKAKPTQAAKEFEQTDATTRYGIDKELEGIKEQTASNLEGIKYQVGAAAPDTSVYRTGLENLGIYPGLNRNISSEVTVQDVENRKTINSLNAFTKYTLGKEYITTDENGNYTVAPEDREPVKAVLNRYDTGTRKRLYELLGLNENTEEQSTAEPDSANLTATQ